MVQGGEGEAGWARGSSPQPHTLPCASLPYAPPQACIF